ncbi:uncharacterized protein N7496_005481 [Penicillium cataractarum]|uniref:AA1-like domain-containing protein n=1 Tax=Penicillium cataractarum TaxID=2100454 RepID=A0A9W9VDK5_9EURO|nr:uncharacterized protein N7496_005481 [Penicillium cataractarum]KAJ5378072.1 hypothetical protein N7496_005481 [Penicillium cataractarum]
MKFTIPTIILAASSAFAAPAEVKRSTQFQVTDFWAIASYPTSSASMHFVLTDPNYPDDTPTDCNLLWTYGNSPKQSARCNNGEYYIKFPQGAPDFNLFTLELERVNGTIAEDRQILLSSNANGGAPGTKWICKNDPSEDIRIRCDYDGTLEF